MRRHVIASAFGTARATPMALATASGIVAPAAGQLTEPFPAVLELERLRPSAGGDGSLGIVLRGHEDDDLAGWSVAAAGDINGDGLDDVAIGAPGRYYFRYYYGPYNMTGRAYILFGRDTTGGSAPAALDLFSLDGDRGFRFDGPDRHTPQTGYGVAGLGDVNGDGVDDFIMGAPGSGDSYVVFGRTAAGGGFPEPVTPDDLHGEGGFTLTNDASSDSGHAVAAAGDINGDGVRDMIIGAPGEGAAPGAGHVVFGRDRGAPFLGSVALPDLTAAEGFSLRGVGGGDRAGYSVALAGDVNADGLADVIIGAPGSDAGEPGSGSSYVVFGRRDGAFPGSFAELDGTSGFRLDGDGERAASGAVVASAGDVNGDGIDDLIVSGEAQLGVARALVVFGRDSASGPGFPPVLQLSTIDGVTGFRIEGVPGGAPAVASAGDLNGDGVDDIALGAPFASPGGRAQAGQTFVVFGGAAAPWPAAIDVTKLDGTNGFRIDGIEAGSSSGHSVAGAGDLNGDGAGDLVIGAPHWYAYAPGEAYIIFGRTPGTDCYADCDGSGSLDFFDFLCFVNLFAAGRASADCDESGELDVFDFLCFQGAFAAGCP